MCYYFEGEEYSGSLSVSPAPLSEIFASANILLTKLNRQEQKTKYPQKSLQQIMSSIKQNVDDTVASSKVAPASIPPPNRRKAGFWAVALMSKRQSLRYPVIFDL